MSFTREKTSDRYVAFQPLENGEGDSSVGIRLNSLLRKSRKLQNLARSAKPGSPEAQMLSDVSQFIITLQEKCPEGVVFPTGEIIRVVENMFDASLFEKMAFGGLLTHQVVCLFLMSFVAAQVPWAHETFIAFIPSETLANFTDYWSGNPVKIALTTTQLLGVAWACAKAFPGITPENASQVWGPFAFVLSTRVFNGIYDLRGWYKTKAQVDQFFESLSKSEGAGLEPVSGSIEALRTAIETEMNRQWWFIVGGTVAPALFGATVTSLFASGFSFANQIAPVATATSVVALAGFGVYCKTCGSTVEKLSPTIEA